MNACSYMQFLSCHVISYRGLPLSQKATRLDNVPDAPALRGSHLRHICVWLSARLLARSWLARLLCIRFSFSGHSLQALLPVSLGSGTFGFSHAGVAKQTRDVASIIYIYKLLPATSRPKGATHKACNSLPGFAFIQRLRAESSYADPRLVTGRKKPAVLNVAQSHMPSNCLCPSD